MGVGEEMLRGEAERDDGGWDVSVCWRHGTAFLAPRERMGRGSVDTNATQHP